MESSCVMLDNNLRILKVSEARVLICESEYDQPEYHIPISKKLNLSGEFLLYSLLSEVHFIN